MRKFLLKKSREKSTDWVFSRIVKTQTLPKSKSLKEYVSQVYDQKSTGFCHSFAAAALKNIQEAMEKGYPHVLSPLYIARRTKEIDGMRDTEGSTLEFAMKALLDAGSVKEKSYPFSAYKEGSLIFPAPGKDLYTYKIKNYARLTTVEDIKQALYLNKPVIIGIICLDSIYSAKDMIPLPNEGAVLGGHALLAIGYDDDKKAFLVQNSWGEAWGEGGFSWLPYEYLTYKTKDIGMTFFMDAYTTVDLVNDPVKETVISMRVGDLSASVNGRDIKLNSPPVIDAKTSRALVPLRDVAELLGFGVYWNGERKEIMLIKEE